jgi:hypothetical protein
MVMMIFGGRASDWILCVKLLLLLLGGSDRFLFFFDGMAYFTLLRIRDGDGAWD